MPDNQMPPQTLLLVKELLKNSDIGFKGPIQQTTLKEGNWSKYEICRKDQKRIDGNLLSANFQILPDKTGLLTCGWPGNRTAIKHATSHLDPEEAAKDLAQQLLILLTQSASDA